MAIDVLGPVNVGAVSLHPRERSVLAALVVRDGSPIAAEDLAQAVWTDAERPTTWNKQIQQAVGRLRKALGADRIVTTSAGYHLDVDPDEIDARRFEELDAELWLAQVCRIAGRNLTAPEWDTYLSHVGEYRETCSFPAE